MDVIEKDPNDSSVFYYRGFKLVYMADLTVSAYNRAGELMQEGLAGLPGAIAYINSVTK